MIRAPLERANALTSMKRDDLENLRKPYSQGDSGCLDDQFAAALGFDCSQVALLFNEIFQDLDERSYGVGWWAPHPGTSRRILISDYFLQCVASVRTNLVEAKLHLHETLDYRDQESGFITKAFKMGRKEKLPADLPPRLSAFDDLPRWMAQLHEIGFFRAIAGALDCMGATVVGVVGLPLSILKANLAKARKELGRLSKPKTDGEHLQAEFARLLACKIQSAGPKGWLNWATDFRNMVVHRGRRLQLVQLLPKETQVLGPDGRPVWRIRAALQLPQEPHLSDVEMFLHTASPPVLTEDAERTLTGLFGTAVRFINETSSELLKVWKARRNRPDLVVQPKQQWPGDPSVRSSDFPGYNPGTVEYNPAQFKIDKLTFRRLMAAALLNDAPAKWRSFD